MSKSQRNRRLRRRQVASQPRLTARRATVAFTGGLLTTAALAVPTASVAAPPVPAPASGETAQRAGQPKVGLVEDVRRGVQGASVRDVVELGDRALVVMDDGRHGRELWVSDGSEAGTRLLVDLNTQDGRAPASSRPDQLTLVGDEVFFSADDGVHGRELWKTDGTAAGTTMLTDVAEPVDGYGYNYPSGLTAIGPTLYFSLDDGVHGQELWTSDGTTAGTGLVADLNTGTRRGKALGSSPGEVTQLGDAVFFTANDGVTGRELWTTDGTAAGTALVTDIRTGIDSTYEDQPASSNPRYLTALGERLYFAADDGVHGSELWSSDGTAAGTGLVSDIRTGTVESGYDDETRPASSRPGSLTAVGTTLYFSADDGTHGTELWKSDGTAAGTALVKDINPGTEGYGYFGYYGITSLGGALYFSTDDGVHGTELWTSDGTAAGTRLVKDIATGTDRRDRPRSSRPRELTVLDDTLYFSAQDAGDARGLWSSDGSSAGTSLYAEIPDGGANSYYGGPSNVTAVGGELFFTADDGVYGQELWSTSQAARSIPRVDNRTVPRISGEVVAGGVLVASEGTWAPTTGLDHSYQWYVGARAIKTATRPRFRPGSSDVGKRIKVRVITYRDGYRGAVAYSVPTALVADEPLVNVTRPAVRGQAKVGARLTATPGRWSVKKLTFRFRWSIGGKAVPGADERTFRLPARAAGKPVTVRVTAVRPAGAKSARSTPRVVERR